MSHENGQLPTVDAVLEQFSRVTVPLDIEQKLDARLKEFLQQTELQTVLSPPTNLRPSRQRFIQVSMAAALAVLVCAALLVVFGGRDAWAQVVRTMRSKPWVRYQHTIQTLKDSPATEMWFSTEHKVIASRTGQEVMFIDLTHKEIYEYAPQSKSLILSQSQYHDKIKSGLLEIDAMLQLVLEGENELKLPGSSIRTTDRTRSEVQEGDRRWTEFKFECRDAQHNPDGFLMIVRVNPETQLPVEVRFTSKNTPSSEITLAIDYPEAGPSDIYALGVPRDAPIVDRRGSTTENSEEIKTFLAAYEQARRKPFEPFSMTVLTSLPEKDFSEIYRASRGRDDGQDVQLEEANQQDLFEITRQYRSGLISRAEDADCAEWWKQQIAGLTFTPMSQGHGFYLLPNRVGYPELMGLGQSPIGNPDCRVTLDRHPRTGPPGTVLLNIRVETTLGFNDMFFWIAPEKDYLVIRHEIHYSKNREAWNNSTEIIDKVEQSPKGRWYATKVRTGRIEKHGADLPAERVAGRSVLPTNTGTEMGPVTTNVYRYLVDFR